MTISLTYDSRSLLYIYMVSLYITVFYVGIESKGLSEVALPRDYKNGKWKECILVTVGLFMPYHLYPFILLLSEPCWTDFGNCDSRQSGDMSDTTQSVQKFFIALFERNSIRFHSRPTLRPVVVSRGFMPKYVVSLTRYIRASVCTSRHDS